MTMTKKITSFFQPNKSSSKIKEISNRDDVQESVSTSLSQKRTVGGDDASTNTSNTKKTKIIYSESADVQQLLLYLNDDASVSVDDSTQLTWRAALQKCCETKSFYDLAHYLAIERQKHTIYPSVQHVWSACNACPLQNVKVVIVGQDPYHGPNQAHGLSFSVLPGCPIPPSLKNMYVFPYLFMLLQW
jgi:hypothetical protein